MISHPDLRRLCVAIALRAGLALAVGVGLLPMATASEYLATGDFHDVEAVVKDYGDRYGAARVLLVVDIDNTLLAMNHDLGSDQWFEWQRFLLKHQPQSPHLVAEDFDRLLEVQGLLFTLGRMHAPQVEQPAILGRLQGLGIHTLVLTSRGESYRVATERELKRNGYDCSRSALNVENDHGGMYLPYDLDDPAAAGLTAAEVTRFGLREAKPVRYENGIMMAAGQHKGAMLLTMLHVAVPDIRAVVFVDDHGRHVGRVFAALTARDIEVAAMHYFHEDDRVARFQYSNKSQVSQRWRRLKKLLDEALE